MHLNINHFTIMELILQIYKIEPTKLLPVLIQLHTTTCQIYDSSLSSVFPICCSERGA